MNKEWKSDQQKTSQKREARRFIICVHSYSTCTPLVMHIYLFSHTIHFSVIFKVRQKKNFWLTIA